MLYDETGGRLMSKDVLNEYKTLNSQDIFNIVDSIQQYLGTLDSIKLNVVQTGGSKSDNYLGYIKYKRKYMKLKKQII